MDDQDTYKDDVDDQDTYKNAMDDQPDALSSQRAQVKAHLRATYGSLYDRLIQILYIADIMTISYFAKDEYEPEVTTILPRLPQATSAAEVERILREEFAYWFYEGLSLDPERFAWAARTIWQMWRAYGLAAEQSPCRKGLVALWWAVKLHCIALVTPIYTPRVLQVDA